MRRFALIAVLLIMSIQNLGFACATNTLQVQKMVQKKDIKVGDDVTILLKFTNPFGQEIPIRIVDKNIFGSNGINIQCLEYTVPNQREVTIAYDPVKPFKSGQYTLDSAEITYTNPETGKEESIKSNTLEVSVKKSNIQQGQTQGITTIYRCNGVNMQSTSYSSSGGFNIQIGPNSQQQSAQQQISPENRVQNNQLNQNANALKQQMERQVQQQKQTEQEFQKNLAKNREFQRMHEDLLRSGYNLTNASFNPVTNDTGDFQINYQKTNGETATLKGEMENGTIKNLMVLTAEDKQKIMQLLRENEQFRKYDRTLTNEGFNQTGPQFNQLSQNHTKITIFYKNDAGEKRKITADYINGTIRNVFLEGGDEEGGPGFWWLLLLIPIAIAAVWVFYNKYLKRVKDVPETETSEGDDIVDYVKETEKMINEAVQLFRKKREKDAYEKVSQAVRFYFSHKLGLNKEVGNTELLGILKKTRAKEYPEIRKCLNLCSLVEFAKYRPDRKDFSEAVRIARKILL
jgi:HEPN domain-containing protein